MWNTSSHWPPLRFQKIITLLNFNWNYNQPIEFLLLKKKREALLKVWNKLNSLSLSPINNHNKIFQFLKWFPIFLFLNYGFLYGCQENINASFYGLGSMVKKIFLKFIHNNLTITKF